MIAQKQIPNALTFARLLAVPVALAVMMEWPEAAALPLFWLFLLASATDYLDGYLARKFRAVTPLGTMLDPVADKLLVALLLLYLLKFDHAFTLMLPVALIVLRELYISGLREFLAARGKKLPVSAGGKWKTAVQMVSILAMLFAYAYHVESAFILGRAGLWAAAFLALFSAYDYTRKALPAI